LSLPFTLYPVCSTFASSVFSPAFRFVAKEYNVSTEVVTLGLSLFVLGFVPGPIGACLTCHLRLVYWQVIISFTASLCTVLRDVWEANDSARTNVYIHLLLGRDSDRRKPADNYDYSVLRWCYGQLTSCYCRRWISCQSSASLAIYVPLNPPHQFLF
jgi:hypothetical protein